MKRNGSNGQFCDCKRLLQLFPVKFVVGLESFCFQRLNMVLWERGGQGGVVYTEFNCSVLYNVGGRCDLYKSVAYIQVIRFMVWNWIETG